MRGDLIRIVAALMRRSTRLDGITIETTGLADPSPVAQTFFVDDGVRKNTTLDAIVTVVDAKHLLARLEDSHEAEEQVAFADVIVLNKTDLVTPEELELVEQRIRTINRSARIMRATKADVPVGELLGRGALSRTISALREHPAPVPVAGCRGAGPPRSGTGMNETGLATYSGEKSAAAFTRPGHSRRPHSDLGQPRLAGRQLGIWAPHPPLQAFRSACWSNRPSGQANSRRRGHAAR